MDYIHLSLILTVGFTAVVTLCNWSELSPLERVLFPL